MNVPDPTYPSFEFYLKTNIVFGINSFAKAGEQALKLGRSALIVSTSGTLLRNGTLTKLQDHLRAQGIESRTTTDISPNPKVSQINALFQTYKETKIDFVIGIGGGEFFRRGQGHCCVIGRQGGPH